MRAQFKLRSEPNDIGAAVMKNITWGGIVRFRIGSQLFAMGDTEDWHRYCSTSRVRIKAKYPNPPSKFHTTSEEFVLPPTSRSRNRHVHQPLTPPLSDEDDADPSACDVPRLQEDNLR